MKMRNTWSAILLWCCLIVPISAWAQEDDSEPAPRKLVIRGGYAATGEYQINRAPFSGKNIQALGLQAVTQNLDTDGSYSSNYYYGDAPFSMRFGGTGAQFTLGLEFQLVNNEKPKPRSRIRAGILIRPVQDELSSRYSRRDLLGRTIRDTIVYLSDRDTTFIYQDSVRGSDRYLRYSNQVIAFDFSWITQTNPDRRISFWGGIGLTPGIILNARTRVTGTDYETWGYGITAESKRTAYYEEFRHGSGFFLSAYCPLGMNVRLSKKNEVLKHVSAFFEWRPRLQYHSISPLGSSLDLGSNSLIGLRGNF